MNRKNSKSERKRLFKRRERESRDKRESHVSESWRKREIESGRAVSSETYLIEQLTEERARSKIRQ